MPTTPVTMSVKFVDEFGDERSTNETIQFLMKQVGTLTSRVNSNEETIEVILKRLHFLESQ